MRKLLVTLSLLATSSTAAVWAQTLPLSQETKTQLARYESSDALTNKNASKLKSLGLATLFYGEDNGKQLDLAEANFSEKLKPYLTDESGFYADAEQKQKFSFNAITTGVDWEKFRFDEKAHKMVLFYEGKDKQLDFTHKGLALVNVASGEVLLVTKEEAKDLLWDVPTSFKK